MARLLNIIYKLNCNWVSLFADLARRRVRQQGCSRSHSLGGSGHVAASSSVWQTVGVVVASIAGVGAFVESGIPCWVISPSAEEEFGRFLVLELKSSEMLCALLVRKLTTFDVAFIHI